ncbi:MAG: hypothetical protein LQ338_002919 [Usnochroma carphineum]|nr:MAG: hypothetical protein LQ338_002919 [Usnochroma carphineum]
MTETIDTLCQTAPHIILFEPTSTRSHKDLYHQMVASERQILEQSKKRRCTFPQSVTKRACRWYRHFTHEADSEQDEAMSLSDSAQSNHLISLYNGNASGERLRNAIKARKKRRASVATFKLQTEQEAQSSHCGIVETKAHAEHPKISQETPKDCVTITVCANLSPSPARPS